jgi:NAD(P)-dependent dehydrogenase (short-subunit alcohol dehydrogenase family)
MKRLEGKSILIVGGTAGLGLSAAKACAAEGARLVVVGRDDESLAAAKVELPGDVRVLGGDAVDPAVAERAVALAASEFGRLDGVYHVAGGSGRRMGDGPLHEITDAGWNATLQLNLTSLFNTNRAAVRQLLAQGGGGSVLNIASVLGWSPSATHFATHVYAAAKSAVIGLTTSCAAYYASRSIRFNVIAPGLVDTPMARRAADDTEIQRFIAVKQPLDGGRIGLPADLDGAVIYFLSDESKFVTGQILAIDGGWSVNEATV